MRILLRLVKRKEVKKPDSRHFENTEFRPPDGLFDRIVVDSLNKIRYPTYPERSSYGKKELWERTSDS